MTDPNNLEGTRTPEEIAENFLELNRIAPTPADRFKLMFSAMNDLPANLPPPTTPPWEPVRTSRPKEQPSYHFTPLEKISVADLWDDLATDDTVDTYRNDD